MHKIVEKNEEHAASCECSDELLVLDREAEILLINRIRTSFGFHSKSFELSLEKYDVGTVFSYLNDMPNVSDEDFISNSKLIADSLASCSNHGSIPGGYLLVLDCMYRDKSIVVLIKAEPHSALNVSNQQAQALKDIILSPSQKLYKAFMMVQKSLDHDKDSFSYFLFDDQFSNASSLAKYFYQDFLGLSISGNGLVLTKLFYDKMLKLTKKTFADDFETQSRVQDLLIDKLNDETELVNPRQTILDIIPEDKRDIFISKVCNDDLGRSFIKNVNAISKTIGKKRLEICHGLNLVGNRELFNNSVNIQRDPTNSSRIIITIDADENRTNAE